MIKQSILALDRVLRGEATGPLARPSPDTITPGTATPGQSSALDVPIAGIAVIILALAATYGACVGTYAVVSGRGGGWLQLLSSVWKIPALLALPLLVTFPSLYVFNALVGSRLTLPSLARLLLAALGVMTAILASFGTIVAFFSFTTESYSFIVLLNVAVFATAGALGLHFLLRTLQRLTPPTAPLPPPPTPTPPPPIHPSLASVLKPAPDHHIPSPDRGVKNVFRVWILLFGLVGAQMAWVLRPFIGSGTDFVLFRPRATPTGSSNFFEAVFDSLARLLGS